MHLSVRTVFIGLFLLLLTSVSVWAGSPQQIKWRDLSLVTGKNVSLVMPGGTFISGKVVGVDADAMRVNVTRTSDPAAYPKGEVRLPRASLRILEVQAKRRKFRVIGTVMGAVAGVVWGYGAAVAIQGGILNNDHPVAAGAAFVGFTAGGTVAGYMVGRRVDRRSTTYEILP
jgi:hypothetical protein